MLIITEALLEMHYHRALVDLFQATYGARFLRLLKPAPGTERWVGFDQGWVNTSISTTDFYNQLRTAMATPAATPPPFYLAHFLQFKVVTSVSRKSKLMPVGFSPPYYRVELSLDPDSVTGMSQHETLLKLSSLPRCSVNYFCPFMFSLDEIYDVPDLARVQIVDVSGAPTGWVTTERHFIAFRDENDSTPMWCSTPIPGHSMTTGRWLNSNSAPGRFSGVELIRFLSDVKKHLVAGRSREFEAEPMPFPWSLSVIELRPA